MKKIQLTKKIINKYGKECSFEKKLFEECKEARKRGFLTKEEFIKICKWKSPRPTKYYMKNSEENIKEITKRAFSLKYEKKKMELLDSLNGVGVRVASAILTVIYPDKYGIIDVRAWNALRNLGIIKGPEKRKNYFSFNDWYRYLKIIKHIAEKNKTTPRKIDLTLYSFDKKTTTDKIY